ncbi:MAG: 4'-phosphopantetheinyl transferase superfamily protein [Alistipes sp.]
MIRTLLIAPPMTEAQAEEWVSAEELAQSRTFGSARRRCEYLTWRALVRRTLGADVQITYNAVGAPVIANRDVYISVAHCAERVAVCLSDAPCAVDIETENRNFTRVTSRYMSLAEQRLSANPLLAAAVWCAKEALYKFAGREGLDFVRDLHVEEVDFVAGRLVGRIENGEALELSIRRDGGCIAVYIL